MDVVDKSGLPECAKLIKVGTAIDKRGQLCFTENAELPFKIERVFWISNIPKGESRGCHAHRICAEIVFPAQGSFDMFVSDSEGERTYKSSNDVRTPRIQHRLTYSIGDEQSKHFKDHDRVQRD